MPRIILCKDNEYKYPILNSTENLILDVNPAFALREIPITGQRSVQ